MDMMRLHEKSMYTQLLVIDFSRHYANSMLRIFYSQRMDTTLSMHPSVDSGYRLRTHQQLANEF